MRAQRYLKKICIGTAQFGSKYGITNKTGKTKISEAKKILKLAKSNKISFDDTAETYGRSQKIIGTARFVKPKIITKIRLFSLKKTEISINKSIKDLNVNSLYALLIHNPQKLLAKDGKIIFSKLKEFKKKKLIKKIGVSEYSVERLKRIISKFDIDIVSFPYNPFDQRLVTTGLLKNLRRKNIEVHVRSIFLQGLLLANVEDIPKKLKRWNKVLNHFENLSQKYSISKIKICLDTAFSLTGVSKITLGVQNKFQLEQILYYLKKTKIQKRTFDYKYNKKLSNPLSWL